MLEEISTQILLLKEALVKANDRLRYLNISLNNTRDLLNNREGLYILAYNDALSTGLRKSTQFLILSAEEALATTQEFSQSIFRNALLLACKNENSILFSRQGKVITVNIDLNSTAGTLEDYANAVKQVRINKNIGKLPPELASIIFYTHYYRVDVLGGHVLNRKGEDITDRYRGKYLATILARIELFSKLAPWWEILDKGSQNISLSSDRGGQGRPITRPTHFTEKARQLIQEDLQSLFNKTYSYLIKKSNDQINFLKNEIEQITKEIEDLTAQLNKTGFYIALEKVKKRLGERLSLADPTKIQRIAVDILAGFRGRRRIGGGQILRTITLSREIQAELEKIK